MKEISIIIATFNAAATLSVCLDSIVSQLTDECELIIIDGNSKDDTSNIIMHFADKIKYTISEPDNGIYDAWNKGLKVANGEWVMFIGADDVLLPNALNHYLEQIRMRHDIHNYDYICAHNLLVNKDGKILKILGEKPQWKKMRKMMVAAHVASLHNRHRLFGEIGNYDLQFKICADYDLLLRKREKLQSLFIKCNIARMRIGGMSFSTKAIKETYLIREKNHSVGKVQNIVLLFRDWIAYKLFVLRKPL